MTESIKMINAALDEAPDGDIVLRGVVDPASLNKLMVDEYQREILPMSKIRALTEAIKTGGVPDIELGMRGGQFLEREGCFYLQDAVYIIDGLQRRTAALELIRKGELPRLGATVHFNTTPQLERERFRKLNVSRVKLSANVLLRNERLSSASVDMIYGLSKDSSFPLFGRVSWDQRMKRDSLLGGKPLFAAAGWLHRRFQPGLVSTKDRDTAAGLDTLMKKFGRNTVRQNIKTFWEVIDECFNLKATVYAVAAPYLRRGFLEMLAYVFSNHENFWEDGTLVVPKDIRKKLATFPLQDPHVAALCGASGGGRKILYEMLVEHINSHKRTRRIERFEESE